MSAPEPFNIAGKDWLTADEAAHYCGVSSSQFRQHAPDYGLHPKRFMGKQLYEKAALYAAIHGSPEWHEPKPSPTLSFRAMPPNLAPVRLRRNKKQVAGYSRNNPASAELGELNNAESVVTLSSGVLPFELRAIGAEEVGELLGLAARTVLETVACRPDFPVRVSMRPATWIAGEVLDWRKTNRARLPKRRRRAKPPNDQ